jgi:hypothetical protein
MPKTLSYIEWKKHLNSQQQQRNKQQLPQVPITNHHQQTVTPITSQNRTILPQPPLVNHNNIHHDHENTTTRSSIRITASAAPTTVARLISGDQQNFSSNMISKTCSICKKASSVPSNVNTKFTENNQIMIDCSKCASSSHPNCLELNPELVDWVCIRQYDWQCMECKICSSCTRPHDEDKMMFCDRCDRGFRTYCVGVSHVPTGSWLCKKCADFKEKLAIINEKINATRKENQIQHNGHSQTLNRKLTSNVLKLKSKLNGSFNETSSSHMTGSPHTPATGEKRGRGRPPGSLNKPKDPNSPSKKIL